MTMQERGKGQDPAITADEADELAASFRPAWDTDEPEAEPTDLDVQPPAAVIAEAAEISATAPIVVPGRVISVGPAGAETKTSKATTVIGGMVAPGAATASAALAATAQSNPKPAMASPDQTLIMPTQPSRSVPPKANPPKAKKSPSSAPGSTTPESMKATQPAASKRQPVPASTPPPKHRSSSTRPPNVAVAADPFRPAPPGEATEELKALVTKRSSKNTLYVVVGLAIATGLIVFLKFALTDDPPKAASKPTSSGPMGVLPPSTTNDIPPPPAKEELPPSKAEAKAETKAEPKPEPPVVKPSEPPVSSPRPEARPETRPEPRPAKPSTPALPASPASPPPSPTGAPKAPPKGPGGGIVRDNPF